MLCALAIRLQVQAFNLMVDKTKSFIMYFESVLRFGVGDSNYAKVGHMSICLKYLQRFFGKEKICWVLQETLVIWQLQVLNLFALTTGMPANASVAKLREVKLVWQH